MNHARKNQGHRDHGKVKYEVNQALVMINLYVKFNAKQVIVLKVAMRRMKTIDVRQNLAEA